MCVTVHAFRRCLFHLQTTKNRHSEVFRFVARSVSFRFISVLFSFSVLFIGETKVREEEDRFVFRGVPFWSNTPHPHTTHSSSAKRGLKDVYSRKTRPRQRPDLRWRENLDGER